MVDFSRPFFVANIYECNTVSNSATEPSLQVRRKVKKVGGAPVVKEVRLTMMVLLLSGQEIGGANGAPGTPKFRQSCTALYQILGMPMSYLITAHKSYLIVDAVLSRHIIFFLCGEINIIIK